MRGLLLCGVLWAGLSYAADPTTTKAPTTTTANPIDQANTDAAQKKLTEMLEAEDKAQKEYIKALSDVKECNEKAATAKEGADQLKKFADFMDTLKTGGTSAFAVVNPVSKQAEIATAEANVATVGGIAKCSKEAGEKALALKSADGKTGTCPDLDKAVATKKTAYDDAKKATVEAQKDFDEKAKKAPPTPPKKDDAANNPLQVKAQELQKKEREAAQELADTFTAINKCPADIAQKKSDASCIENYKKKLDEIKAAIAADTSTNKAADAAKLPAEKITEAEKAQTEAKKPIAAEEDRCKKIEGELDAKKKAHEAAEKAAEEAQKVAANPSLASSTTVAPTTAAATTGATSASTASGASGASAAANASATTPASAASADEGPDATKNVDGVPLTPSSPCCQKAAAGLCKVSMMIRNQCNTECGCVKAKGTCTGKPPKKCTPDGSGSDLSGGEPPAASCTDASSDCAGWAKDKQCSMAKGFWMQNQCTKSCDLCNSGGDVDQYHCWGWAFLGECEKSAKGWMMKFCKLSCANAKKNPAKLSLAQRRKMVSRIARARTLKRIKAARATAAAKIKRRRAKAARAALAKKTGRSRIRSAAARRRRLRILRAKAAAKRKANN